MIGKRLAGIAILAVTIAGSFFAGYKTNARIMEPILEERTQLIRDKTFACDARIEIRTARSFEQNMRNGSDGTLGDIRQGAVDGSLADAEKALDRANCSTPAWMHKD
jgi:hypothetical protein